LYHFEQLAVNVTLRWWLHRLAKQKVSFVFHSTKDPQKIALENWVFCIRYFSKMKCKSSKTLYYYRMMFFMSKQVSLPKISSILKKWKSAQKAIYVLFTRKPSIVMYEVQLFVFKIWNNWHFSCKESDCLKMWPLDLGISITKELVVF